MASPNSPVHTSSRQLKSTSSSLLEHTRRTQVEALESRTARRIETLLGGPPVAHRREKSSGGNESMSSKAGRGSPLVDAVKQTNQLPLSGSEEEAVPFRNTGGTPLLQSSVGKRNITQRRSRGRSSRDDGTTAPDPMIVARRPRSRSKDRRYSLESTVMASNPGNLVASNSFTAGQEPDVWPDFDLFRGAYSRSPVSPARVHGTIPTDSPVSSAKVHGTILTNSHPDIHSVNRGVRDHERSQARMSERESQIGHDPILSPVFQDSLSDDSSGSDDGPKVGDADTLRQEEIHGGVFLKKYIPEQDSYPALHDHLSSLWDHRQTLAAAMNLALEDDDVGHYSIYRDLFDQANQEMHEVLQEGLRNVAKEHCGIRALPKSGSSSARTEPISSVASSRRLPNFPAQPPAIFSSSDSSSSDDIRWRGVDSLPKRWRGVDSLPFVESMPKHPLKKSYKETDHNFEIFFSYQGVVVSRLVNENLPLKILYSMGRSYLETDFGFRVQGDYDFNLELGGRLLTRSGVLSDVPICTRSLIMIIYPIKPPVSGEIPSIPSAKSDHSFLREGPSNSIAAVRPIQHSPMDRTQHERDRHRPTGGVQSERNGEELYERVETNSLDPKSYDKIRQNFKCPKFSGQARDWKIWDKGFWRYLSIWELEYVLDPSFFDVVPLNVDKKRDNKLVYYIIEDAVQNSTLAASYIKQAPIGNGFEAYYTLHDGYVFAGATTATLLLNELSNFRFLADETPTELCLRLDELFQELRDLPGDAAVTFIDTQKVGYLVNALRHEKEWEYVCSAITSAQIKGGYTFREACNELKFRCESSRANDLMDKPVKGKRVKGYVSKPNDDGIDMDLKDDKVSAMVMGLISSMSKKLNTDTDPGKKSRRKQRPSYPCLAADCEEQTSFPLCPLHYHPLLSGKSQHVKLKSGYGEATYDSSSQSVVYPPKVPENRLSTKQIEARKMVSAKAAVPAHNVSAKVAGPQ